MNKELRKELDKAIELIEEARAVIDSVSDSERQSFENLSEGLQASEKGQKFEENADLLDDVSSELENQIDSIRQAQE